MEIKIEWLRRKLPAIIATFAVIIAIVNIYFSSDIAKAVVFILGIISIAMSMLRLLNEVDKFTKYYLLKSRECEDLKWSYEQMGSYIEQMKIPELADLELRIKNELRDIKVKQEYTAEQLGISKKELKKLQERRR